MSDQMSDQMGIEWKTTYALPAGDEWRAAFDQCLETVKPGDTVLVHTDAQEEIAREMIRGLRLGGEVHFKRVDPPLLPQPVMESKLDRARQFLSNYDNYGSDTAGLVFEPTYFFRDGEVRLSEVSICLPTTGKRRSRGDWSDSSMPTYECTIPDEHQAAFDQLLQRIVRQADADKGRVERANQAIEAATSRWLEQRVAEDDSVLQRAIHEASLALFRSPEGAAPSTSGGD